MEIASLIDTTDFDQKALTFLHRCQSRLTLSDEELSDTLSLSSVDLSEFKAGKFTPNIKQIYPFFEKYNIGLNSIVNDDFDFDVLTSSSDDSSFKLPSLYTKAARSRMVTLANIFDHLEERYGWQVMDYVLKHFQIPFNYKDNLFFPISVNLFEAVLAYLRQWLFSDNDLYAIARRSIFFAPRTEWTEKYYASRTPQELYQFFFTEVVPVIDKNNVYIIEKMDSEGCIIESYEDHELCEELETTQVAGRERCIYRNGTLAPLMEFIGLPAPVTKELSCIHLGDSYCSYEIDFPKVI